MNNSSGGRAPACTFLVHHFGRGLIDEGRAYAIERFRACADGDIRRWPLIAPAGRVRRRPKPEVATFQQVREMRPAFNEVIVCTALGTRSGLQLWGTAACSIFPERRQRR